MTFLLRSFFLIGFSLLAGCATVPTKTVILHPAQEGVYHKVKRGQTLWRIAKTYSVPLDEIIQINHIPNVAKLEENQLVSIPGASAVKDIIIEKEDNQKDFIWPVNGKVVHYFRERHRSMVNKGIDIQPSDGEPIKAARSGQVVFADYLPGYYYTIILDHEDGFHSVYARNSHLLVKVGDQVAQSAPIAQIGSADESAKLHFQVRRNGREDNPLYYLP